MIELIIISGAYGSGKSYLISNSNYFGSEFVVIKKKTTRQPRINENIDNNTEFTFNVSKEDVLSCENNYFFRDNLYGFDCAYIDNLIMEKKISVIIIRRVNEIKALKMRYKKSVAILCESNLDTGELCKLLQKNGSSFDGCQTRLFSVDEKTIKKEYKKYYSIFDLIVRNNYDSAF